jgi:hypothetical protein
MNIQNFEKINGQKFDLAGAQFYVADAELIGTKYYLKIYELDNKTECFEIRIGKHKDYLDVMCYLMGDNTIKSQTKFVLRKNDIQNITSFLTNIGTLILKSPVMYAYVHLISEIQKTNKNKNKLKVSTPGGLYNTNRSTKIV